MLSAVHWRPGAPRHAAPLTAQVDIQPSAIGSSLCGDRQLARSPDPHRALGCKDRHAAGVYRRQGGRTGTRAGARGAQGAHHRGLGLGDAGRRHVVEYDVIGKRPTPPIGHNSDLCCVLWQQKFLASSKAFSSLFFDQHCLHRGGGRGPRAPQPISQVTQACLRRLQPPWHPRYVRTVFVGRSSRVPAPASHPPSLWAPSCRLLARRCRRQSVCSTKRE